MRRIIGCGNLLFKDEGIGIHLIEYLKGKDIPGDVEVVDGATGGFDLLPVMEGASRLIIVDAVKAGGNPGDIYRFTPEDFQEDQFPKTSFHDVSLKDIFDIIKLKKTLPTTTIFGVEPKEIDWGLELTEEVERILPRLYDLVIKELKDA